MDDDDVAAVVAVGVGVLLGGAAVGGPAGVADAEGAVDGIEAEGLFEVAELALGAADSKLSVVAVDGETGGVVTALFEAPEALQDNRDCFVPSDVADNPAHGYIIG